MISVCDVLVVVLVTTNTPLVVALKFTVTDVTQLGGSVVFQVTLAPRVVPPTLSALTARWEDRN